MWAIYKKELSSYFNSALGYIILALYLFFSGYFFYFYCFLRAQNGLVYVVSNMITIVLFLVPLITMRSFAEEKRQHTDQALITAPVGLNEIVLGKYLSALTLYVICNLVYFFYAFMLAAISDNVVLFGVAAESGQVAIPWAHLLWAMLGSVLVGAALLSVNLWFSSLTEHQIIAAVLGLASGLFIMLFDAIVSIVENFIGAVFNTTYTVVVLDKLSVTGYYQSFVNGIVSPVGVVFFLCWIAFFLFLTNRVLDRKRWA